MINVSWISGLVSSTGTALTLQGFYDILQFVSLQRFPRRIYRYITRFPGWFRVLDFVFTYFSVLTEVIGICKVSTEMWIKK
jgi:hypothetical protein